MQDMIEDVNTTFHDLKMRIVSHIDKLRNKMINQIQMFYLKETTKS